MALIVSIYKKYEEIRMKDTYKYDMPRSLNLQLFYNQTNFR